MKANVVVYFLAKIPSGIWRINPANELSNTVSADGGCQFTELLEDIFFLHIMLTTSDNDIR
jgi:hypothetical protein